jgi:hypothetical protein
MPPWLAVLLPQIPPDPAPTAPAEDSRAEKLEAKADDGRAPVGKPKAGVGKILALAAGAVAASTAPTASAAGRILRTSFTFSVPF